MAAQTTTGHSNALADGSNPTRPPKLKVAVVGGTHGNEYTGVFVVRRLEAMRESLKQRYPHLEIKTVVGNVAAHDANRRFLDEDLNRRFSMEELEKNSNKGFELLTVEARRALELDQMLGPKKDPTYDLVVDLHTTTTNMGTTIIVDEWDANFGVRLASFVMRNMENHKLIPRLLFNKIPSREASPYLASMGRHSLEIECGPTPQGVLRHDVVEATEMALFEVLKYVDANGFFKAQDDSLLSNGVEEVEAFETLGSNEKLSWPIDPDTGFPTAVVHKDLQDKDYAPLYPGDPVFVTTDGDVITYDGQDVVYPIFINEGGYYYASSGRGIGLTRKVRLAVPAPIDLFAEASASSSKAEVESSETTTGAASETTTSPTRAAGLPSSASEF